MNTPADTDERSPPFAQSAPQFLQQLIDEGPAGNRWFKVNLHVHGQGNDPAKVVRQAREAEIDLLAITDHQTFRYYPAIAEAAHQPGRPLVVLPGIEITTPEGVHLLAIFPETFSEDDQKLLYGWLRISGAGDTKQPARPPLADIIKEINDRGGVLTVPHPKSPKIGMMDSARKIGIKEEWLDSGYVRLMQAPAEYVRFIERDDDENFVNRYVLASARPQDICSSTYCLAPFNSSDAQTPDEVPEGCSWFRMQHASVAGLKQVACEPHTRISREAPTERTHDCIMAIRVSGGYCDTELFQFNDGLNCIVGQNYAGESAVFDFLRFALGGEDSWPKDARERLLNRLNGILWEDGSVEVFLRSEGEYYVVKRTFRPRIRERHQESIVVACDAPPQVYRLDPSQHDLVPVDDFEFPIEVYEQGRIGRLRDDVDRQLDMLDEFAHLWDLRAKRTGIIDQLRRSGRLLKPLYEEREKLKSALAKLPDLKKELKEKAKLIPDEEEENRWAAADEVVDEIEETIEDLRNAVDSLPSPEEEFEREEATELVLLFGREPPHFERNEVAEANLLTKWTSAVKTATDAIQRARTSIVSAVKELEVDSVKPRKDWKAARSARQNAVRAQLAKANVESPSELISRVKTLRRQIATLEKTKTPRLTAVDTEISKRETQHNNLVSQLEKLDRQITKKREEKACDLTESLHGQIKVELLYSANTDEYERVLDELCDEITSQEHKISSRKGQLRKIVESVTPLELAAALAHKGLIDKPDGELEFLQERCAITENTQSVLCRIADDIELLTRLQTTSVPDVPRILVRRRREHEYANLRTGLSPGEQSAAILTLALQTRQRPLVIDQPEDELGYAYVVHLVVPKTLEVKSSRQLLVITHNANVPVLGDADYVTKMENVPQEGGGRRCVVEEVGCFESAKITDALIELDGGRRAFEFRQYRYALPR
jgi:DNA repair ATPase RecN